MCSLGKGFAFYLPVIPAYGDVLKFPKGEMALGVV